MKINLGDYVLGSHWQDADPMDPWIVGWVCQMKKEGNRIYYRVGLENGFVEDQRWYRNVKKIGRTEGEQMIKDRLMI